MELTEKEKTFMYRNHMHYREVNNEDRLFAKTDFQRASNYIIGVEALNKYSEYYVKKVNLKTLKECLTWANNPRFNK